MIYSIYLIALGLPLPLAKFTSTKFICCFIASETSDYFSNMLSEEISSSFGIPARGDKLIWFICVKCCLLYVWIYSWYAKLHFNCFSIFLFFNSRLNCHLHPLVTVALKLLSSTQMIIAFSARKFAKSLLTNYRFSSKVGSLYFATSVDVFPYFKLNLSLMMCYKVAIQGISYFGNLSLMYHLNCSTDTFLIPFSSR